MTNSALTLTEQGPTHDSGYRVRRGFTQCVWERVFGTNAVATIPTGIACTSVNALWDQTAGTGAGFWPFFPEGFPTWKADRKPGNAEMQNYKHVGTVLRDGSNNIIPQGTLGNPHVMGPDYLDLLALTSCASDAEVTSSYTENTDTSVLHPLTNGSTIVCEIPAGLSGFTVGKQLYIGNRHSASGSFARGCKATVVSYSGTTLTATSNGADNNMTTGSYHQLYIIQRNFEAGMLITRTNLPPVVEGYWEVEQQLPSGAGHWSAHWWIHENIWPPEVDGHERFETSDSVNDRAHAGYISNQSGTTISQHSRMYSAWSTADTTSSLRNMDWGTDLTTSSHTYGLEWGPNFLAHTLDDTLTRTEFYRWIAEGNNNALPVGAFSFAPRFVFNYALGPPIALYRPLTLAKFGAANPYRIKSARLWVRP